MTADRAHDCPGGCGRRVVNTQYACRPCWLRLPWDIRDRITRAYAQGNDVAHFRAKVDAANYYQDHPRTVR